MSAPQAPVTPAWLDLREPADARARSTELVDELARHLGPGAMVVHDLGCGTGSMPRWLAPRLPGPQHWVLVDRDIDLLEHAAATAPATASDGSAVTVETRRRDITRLAADDLAGASLITASALLDMFSADELDRFVASCASPGCPVLLTISVTGRVDLDPADPMDEAIREAFNSHQRRTTGGRHLLGPDAVHAAAQAFDRSGYHVELRPSDWRLAASDAALTAEWLDGWVQAACQQRPDLTPAAESYRRRRLAEASGGRLTATVRHLDLLARPR